MPERRNRNPIHLVGEHRVLSQKLAQRLAARHRSLVHRPLSPSPCYMSDTTYITARPRDKPLTWLKGAVKSSPPFSAAARVEVGWLLRRLQCGDKLSMPHSRPMPSIGARCRELRVTDAGKIWRLVYRIDADVIVIAELFQKATGRTPSHVVEACRRRLRLYDAAHRGG